MNSRQNDFARFGVEVGCMTLGSGGRRRASLAGIAVAAYVFVVSGAQAAPGTKAAMARAGGVPVAGERARQFPAVRFATDVLPVLTKNGCNSGACHGAAAGKGGFKLSLRGYDPASDYEQIARLKMGGRIHKTDPAASLLLKKA